MPSVSINGTQLAYATYGEGPHPLVLLHGAYLDHRQWEPQLAALSAGYRIIAPDLRGHGQSGGQGRPFTIAQLAEDIAALMRSLGLPPAIICGHSLGGMIVQQLALERPELVRAIILAETTYGTRATPLEALLTDMVTPLLLLAPVALQSRLIAGRLGRRSPAGRAYLRRALAAFDRSPETYRAIWRAVVAFDSGARIARMRAPALILAGAESRQAHAQARTLVARIPRAQLAIIADAGHLINWDAPGLFNTALLRFAGAASRL